MDLIRINDVVESTGLSSRTLRYYEEKGLIWSHHPENKAQRYYDAEALERLRQIIVLRKLQIPIKDIALIFENENTSALIQAFVNKLESLDGEITALSELRRLVDDFLHKMIDSGIKKISAIPLLYEETEKRLGAATTEPISYNKLAEVSREALKLHDVRIIRLPEARMLTSRLKTGQIEGLDGDKMQNLFAKYGLLPHPGMRNCFYRQEEDGEWLMMIQIPNDYDNQTPYNDEYFPGGLYAVTCAYFEDMDDRIALLKDWIAQSEDYQPDPNTRAEMIEEILPWDIATNQQKYQQDIFIPIKLKGE